MLLIHGRTLMMKVTFSLFLAVCVFLCWHISYDVQMTFPRSYSILECQEKLQARSPTSVVSTTQSTEKLKQHKTTLITTTSCMRPYFLPVLVSSAPYNGKGEIFA